MSLLLLACMYALAEGGGAIISVLSLFIDDPTPIQSLLIYVYWFTFIISCIQPRWPSLFRTELPRVPHKYSRLPARLKIFDSSTALVSCHNHHAAHTGSSSPMYHTILWATWRYPIYSLAALLAAFPHRLLCCRGPG
jgi:hypothetical protein